MSSNKREEKIYGAVDTEDHIHFTGFCKKINSKEQHLIYVFIDGNLADTLESNKNIEEIENKYDMYDTNGFCFEYKINENLIGEKHKIEFLTKDNEHLLKSPLSSIEKTHKRFFEYSLLESLKTETSTIDSSIKNSIGLLGTSENIEDNDFTQYIKQIITDFPKIKFKIFIFNNDLNNKIKEIFPSTRIEFILLKNIKDIFKEAEVYLCNNDRNSLDTKILHSLRKITTDLFCVGLNLNLNKITVLEHENKNEEYFKPFFNNLEAFGFTNQDIINYGNTYHELYFLKAEKIYNTKIDFNMNQNMNKAYIYWNLTLGFHNHDFFKYSIDFSKRFAKIQSE